MRKIVMSLVVLVLVAIAGYWGWQYRERVPFLAQGGSDNATAIAQPPQAGGDQPIAVEAERVTVGPLRREVSAVGSLRSNESVIIRPEIAGRIAKIYFEEGQRVAQGQPLVKLDDTTYLAQLEEAKANLTLSQANSDRAQKLYRQGAGTERSRDEAEARLLVDRAAIEMARAQLEKTLVTAPFDGIVGLRKVSVGAYVPIGADVVNLENIDQLKVDFRVPEIYLRAVRVGQSLAIRADAIPGATFQGEVYAIDPLIDVNGRSLLVRARIPNQELSLRPGLFVRVSLIVEEIPNAIMIPEEAVVPRGNQTLVYKVLDGGFREVSVRLGLRRGGRVEVVEGLGVDDVVITAGQLKLRPGAKVKVISEAVPSAQAKQRQGA